MVNLELQH